MQSDISASNIVELHLHRTQIWHVTSPSVACTGFLELVERNHLANFCLWHEEDVARRDDLGAERIRQAKRCIDGFNQQRNDYVEAMDQYLFKALNPKLNGCPFHSETPGMMIDRLSILSLKAFHMMEESIRSDATPDHKSRCKEKLIVIQIQLQDLSTAFSDLLDQVEKGIRTYRIYFQFKMYNDRQLNPELRDSE